MIKIKKSDGQGGFDSNWVELDKLWAKAVEQSPRERFYRGEEQHTQGFILRLDKIKQSQYQQREIVLIYE